MIKSLQSSLTANEKGLSEFVINNLSAICNMTAQELAETTHTSPAAVIRFSKKLGFSGFKEFQIEIAKNIKNAEKNADIFEQITVNDSTETIISKVANAHINAVKNTEYMIKASAVDEAVEAILKANCIYLFGMGSSYVVALDFEYKLVRLNMPVSLHSDYHLQLVSASNISKNDVAIAISNSGKTKETYNSLKLAKDRGAKCISITHHGKTPISEISDVNINTVEIEQGFRIGAISSRIAQLTVMDMIFMCLTKKKYDQIPKYIIESGSIISNLKIK